MADILGLVLPFFGLILLGWIAGRRARQPVEAMGWLNIFIIYLALPALFFKLVARTPFEELTRFDFILSTLGVTYSIFTLAFLLARFLRRAKIAEATMQGLAAAYGNIGYMGPGLALLAFGEKAAVPVALIVCFENALHFAVAPTAMALAARGTDGGSGHLALIATIVKRIAFHPFILAMVAGFAFAGFRLPVPEAAQRLIDYLAQTAAPCALFAMGVTLALRPLKRVPAEIGYIVPLKLIVHPAAMYLGLSLVGSFDPVWVWSAVLLAALPTATNVFVIGQQYGVWPERASATVLITTACSVVTITGLLVLIRSGALAPDLFP
ncbi:hypothetical protein SAMN05880582_101461 [Rhizobium sp. RU20A]|uniref:AEC family transporter n=1 Tax=Rhizobium sp. RU20A TaxID=1907412 RepID=UPI0009548825|nr:AEC family transporter [Rhizobium sp. RU20A]SIQ03199.1 hypothetical protein SAMN05880582_101461 [Rhizobium sp. RU20A]